MNVVTRIVYDTEVSWTMRQKKGKVIIWPEYLDSELSRSEGRRIPKNLGAPDVDLKILREGAALANLDAQVETGKTYPRGHEERGGYLIVENPDSHKKGRLLLMLAKGVRRAVAERIKAKKESAKGKGRRRRRR
ncbi:hypothetical protein EU537_03770 [Candidatus Thorarchaeota archaeon]|nr:MAG: hypothetical protein EU537_03770 [Candidatus Thorarchaeota archaeon]